ncbi:MAG: SDR family oxidoreductase [Halioglobus sp.]|jgi:NAD(P)-dependent dehydrogenase (short-subunit alcohol dehydrogenase family)
MTDLFSVKDKTALVTGGCRGLGRMISEALVRGGARVYVTSRKAAACEEAAREMSEFGTCLALPGELDTPENVVALAGRFKEREQHLDILVNNAGKTWGAPLEAFPDSAWPGVMEVNVQAPFTLIRELLPALRAGGQADREAPARVINIGSVAGETVSRLKAFSYTASKAAIHHLSRELAAELVEDNITVNVIAPGFFPSSMTKHVLQDDAATKAMLRDIPLHRLGTPEDIGGLAIFLCSRAGAYMTGQILAIDGGLSGCR